jgi:hypothetical protein
VKYRQFFQYRNIFLPLIFALLLSVNIFAIAGDMKKESKNCFDPRSLHSEKEDRWAKWHELSMKDRLVIVMKSQNQSIGETPRTVFESKAAFHQYQLHSQIEKAIEKNKLICLDPKSSSLELVISNENAWPEMTMKTENISHYDPAQFAIVVKENRIEFWNRGEIVFTEWHSDKKSTSEKATALMLQLESARKDFQPVSVETMKTGRLIKKTWGSLKAHTPSKEALPLLEEELPTPDLPQVKKHE